MKIRITAPLAILVFVSLAACTEDAGSLIATSETDMLYSSTGASVGTSGNPGNTEAGVITAGEWNDLQEWTFWNNLMKNDTLSVHRLRWGFNPANRYSFILKDVDSNPIHDAELILKDSNGQELWAARSDNFGKAELWSGLFNDTEKATSVTVSYENQSFTFDDPTPIGQGTNEISLSIATTAANTIDVMLVVDATGSMIDELEYLKKELYDVLDRVQQGAANNLRTGSVFYRDLGDEYVSRTSPFNNNVNTTVEFVKNQSAGGGGDFPEAVHTALQKAVQEENWTPRARTRLLFLILDAPPHETPEVKEKLQALMRQAAKTGIKIIPITASGIDKSTEFLMRFFSITTNGTYVFITNHSGIGNSHLNPTIGEYEVEYLNNLMVRLITKYSQ